MKVIPETRYVPKFGLKKVIPETRYVPKFDIYVFSTFIIPTFIRVQIKHNIHEDSGHFIS
jgi:hypothetical protein